MKILFALFAFSILAACGGGGGTPPKTETPSTDMPDMTDGNDEPPTRCAADERRNNAGDCEPHGLYFLDEIGARYAHAEPRNYRGQGVTIFMGENLRHTHELISANIVSLAMGNSFERDGRKSHGTGVAGMLVNVAPSIRLFNGLLYSESAENGVEIINHSLGSDYPDGLSVDSPLAMLTTHAEVVRQATLAPPRDDEDIVRVNANSNFNRIENGNHALVPYIRPGLEDNWLMVSAVDTDLKIRSAGCRHGMMWCVVAFGVSLQTAHSDSDTALTVAFGGTSYATPQVAGALAVLKSAANDIISPTFPMTVVRQILLTTATDLGDPGIDEVYGWGLVNISAGIVSIEAMETADGTKVSALRSASLPAEFSHLHSRLDSVSVALRITDRSYHNVALSDILRGGGDDSASSGEAAKEIMTAEYDAGESFRFWGGMDYAADESRFIAAGDSLFAPKEAEDIGGYVRWTTSESGKFSAFGEYEYTDIHANYAGDSLITKIEDARAEGIMVGLQMRDAFRHGDNLRFSARQRTRISGGEMILQYPFAEGDSHKAFIGEGEQTIRTETARIPLKQKAEIIYAAGYTREIPAFAGMTKGGEWTAAAEWNSRTDNAAFSAQWRVKF